MTSSRIRSFVVDLLTGYSGRRDRDPVAFEAGVLASAGWTAGAEGPSGTNSRT